jgi:oxygen-independent coproporphyrinogen-3 oxidase
MKGHQKKMDTEALPDRDLRVKLRDLAKELLVAEGYVEIGMDHYALADDPLSIAQQDGSLGRNFMGYTINRASDMVGLGISSIGYVAGAYFQNVRKLSTYRSLVGQGLFTVDKGFVLSDDDLRRADVIAELMCNFRVHKATFEARFGQHFDSYFSGLQDKLDTMAEDGLIEVNAHEIHVTPTGQGLIRAIARVFDAYLADITPARKFSAAV